MSRSSARRGQVEPTAALAATFAVVVGLGLYAGALADATPGRADRDLAKPALDRAHAALSPDGTVVLPDRIGAGRRVAPDGYRTNVTVRTAERRWTAGPAPPRSAETAARSVGVRLGPADVRAGTLRVEVWP
ncbi:MAG: hypothetical protein ABEJ43_07255 [Haloferacaceae archaeon]